MKKTYIAPELEICNVTTTILAGSMTLSDETFTDDLGGAHSKDDEFDLWGLIEGGK